MLSIILKELLEIIKYQYIIIERSTHEILFYKIQYKI